MPRLDQNWLNTQARTLDIPLIGITGPEPLTDFLPRLKKRLKENPDGVPFVRNKPEKRIDFHATMPNVKTVIVIGVPMPLFPRKQEKSKKKHGLVASVAAGEDYHVRVMRKCKAILDAMTETFGAAEERAYVDNSRLVDKAAAWRAGLGFFGKNNLLINEMYGSAFNIGAILTAREIAFEPIEPQACRCGNCTACLDACPTDALGDGFQLDYKKCVSALTQQKQLTDEETGRIKTFIYGCDICQWVCPYNKRHRETIKSQTCYDLDDLIEMDDAQFEATFGESALAWRGAKTIRRNAQILKNRDD